MAIAFCKSWPDVYQDKAVKLCIQAGFRKILTGDTKFSQTKHLDRWDAAGNIRFIFGYEATDGPATELTSSCRGIQPSETAAKVSDRNQSA